MFSPYAGILAMIIQIWSLQVVKKGDTIFIGQYLFTGSETTSVWLEVRKYPRYDFHYEVGMSLLI